MAESHVKERKALNRTATGTEKPPLLLRDAPIPHEHPGIADSDTKPKEMISPRTCDGQAVLMPGHEACRDTDPSSDGDNAALSATNDQQHQLDTTDKESTPSLEVIDGSEDEQILSPHREEAANHASSAGVRDEAAKRANGIDFKQVNQYSNTGPGHQYSNTGSGHNYFGNVYYNAQPVIEAQMVYEGVEGVEGPRARNVGIFSLVDNTRRSEELTSTRHDRQLAFTKRHQTISYLPANLGAYQNLDVVKSPQIRKALHRIAHFFLKLDKVFATLFVDVLQAEDHCHLSSMLAQVRQQITDRYAKDRVGKVFIGDLGQHCELLLERHKNLLSDQKVQQGMPLKFQVSHGADEDLLAYLQNGLEIPYWRIMLDTFHTFRANSTTMATDMLSLALHHLKSEAKMKQDQLLQLVDVSSPKEDIKGILSGLDKRIEVLHSFTDNSISNAEEDVEIFRFMISKSTDTPDEISGVPVLGTTDDFDKPVQPSPALTAFTMLSIISAFLPFIIGFATSFGSEELGKTKDADFWYNVSSCVTVIFGNFTMIFPLLKGSWFSAPYMIMWMWFAAGITFSGLSIGLYPNRNTCWSSAFAFMATIAGFGATLNITMTVGKDQSKPRKLKPE